MDLNKDNKNIYTIDRESYSKHMEENRKEPHDLLGSFIKLLLFVLLIVVSYFFYKIVKADLSFTEVFNKKELMATYELFDTHDKPTYVEADGYIEPLVQNIPMDKEASKKTVLLSVTEEYNESVVVKKEKVKERINVLKEVISEKIEPTEQVSVVEEVIIDAEVIVLEKPKVVKTIKEVSEENILSESYLKRMSKELDSL